MFTLFIGVIPLAFMSIRFAGIAVARFALGGTGDSPAPLHTITVRDMFLKMPFRFWIALAALAVIFLSIGVVPMLRGNPIHYVLQYVTIAVSLAVLMTCFYAALLKIAKSESAE